MDDKSYVSLELQQCLLGTSFDMATLLDRRLGANMAHNTTTGWGLCSEHLKLFKGRPRCSGRMRSAAQWRTVRFGPDEA